jgi:hypothetical protein
VFTPYQIIYLLIIMAGFLTGRVRIKKIRPARPIVVLLGLTLLSEVISRITAYKFHNNSIVYHFFNPLQAIAWGWFFYINLLTARIKRLVIPLLSLLILFSVLNTLLWQPLNTNPWNFIKFESLFLLFFSANVFIELLDRPACENIFRNSVFIVCIGIIWFVLTSFEFFNFFNFYVQKNIPKESIRAISYFSNYIYYTLLLIAMFLNSKTQIQ